MKITVEVKKATAMMTKWNLSEGTNGNGQMIGRWRLRVSEKDQDILRLYLGRSTSERTYQISRQMGLTKERIGAGRSDAVNAPCSHMGARELCFDLRALLLGLSPSMPPSKA